MRRRLMGMGALVALAATVCLGGCTSPTSTQGLDAAGLQQVREELDLQWEWVLAVDPTASRPEVEIVRLLMPEEWAPVTAECLRTQGFPDVTARFDGGVTPGTLAQGQLGAYQLATYTCAAMYPIDPKYRQPLDEQQLRALYDHYAGPLTACLEGIGLSVADPPSFEVFKETFATAETWNPVAGAVGSDFDAYQRVYAECDLTPAGLYDR